jgi:hypothetical protein
MISFNSIVSIHSSLQDAHRQGKLILCYLCVSGPSDHRLGRLILKADAVVISDDLQTRHWNPEGGIAGLFPHGLHLIDNATIAGHLSIGMVVNTLNYKLKTKSWEH